MNYEHGKPAGSFHSPMTSTTPTPLPNRHRLQASRLKNRGTILLLAFVSLSFTACAPDSFDNYRAKGFDAYLETLQSQCKNFQIGSFDVGSTLRGNGIDTGVDQYDFWLDQTSRLYYNRLSPAEYRASVESQLGAGSHNEASFACIFQHLPVQRPNQPPGAPALPKILE